MDTPKVCARKGCDEPANGSKYCQAHNIERLRLARYGLTQRAYNALYARQKGVCAGCATTDAPLVVDHDHSTGTVRGLLCAPCNLGLGLLGDKPQTLTRLLAYLTRQQASPTLTKTLQHPTK